MRKDEEVNRALAAYQSAVASVDGFKDVDQGSIPAQSAKNEVASAMKPPSRTVRPYINRHDAITEYSERELMTMVDWIESDCRLRSDEQIIDELLPELGFQRRGARIEGVLKSVLERRRNRPKAGR
jgi:hypothetical protein